jgi:hypothetical protein
MPPNTQLFFPARVIAAVAGWGGSKTVHRRAQREGWPKRKRGNFYEWQPPRALRAKCLLISQQTNRAGFSAFVIETSSRAEIFRAHNRFAAISGLETALQSGMRFKRALAQVARDFTFQCHPSSLRRWQHRFSKDGFIGLLEKKRGNSGRKPKAKK